MRTKTLVGIILALGLLLVAGCGGGGDGDSATGSVATTTGAVASTVSGTASNGAAMTGTVYLKDASGAERSVAIGSGGSYSIAVDGLGTPFLLKAVSSDGSLTRFSFTASTGTVNINPFTHVAVAGVAGTADLDAFYKSNYINQHAVMSAGFKDYVASLKTNLATLFANYGVTDTDFLNGGIQIGKGVDAIFDYVKLSANASANTITLTATTSSTPFLTLTRSGTQLAMASDSANMPKAATTSAGAGTTTASTASTGSAPTSAGTASKAAFTMTQTISDGAQGTTMAFSGLALMTGNLAAQSFYPPGKVADYTGFQYLRDNDPDSMGHNTSFLTRVANNVIYILNDTQLAQLSALAATQQTQIDLYGYKRYPLMQAFRRLIDSSIPSSANGLNLNAVKKASRELYLIDGQISFDRAVLYASVINSLTTAQKTYLDAMKGKGWSSWPDITDAQISSKMSALAKGSSIAVMTYASDIYSWYAGSLEADIYFCPERHGTYYGGFYIKDAPAVGHEGYSIDEQMTATAGSALIDTSKGYVTQDQATVMYSLVATQKDNLNSIVSTRTQIATLLRSLLTSSASADSVKAQVLALSATYGELDGSSNYQYATIFAKVYKTLSTDQKTKLAALRKSMMSGKYADGTAFDYSVATTPFLYSTVLTNAQIAPYITDAVTDGLFVEP